MEFSFFRNLKLDFSFADARVILFFFPMFFVPLLLFFVPNLLEIKYPIVRVRASAGDDAEESNQRRCECDK